MISADDSFDGGTGSLVLPDKNIGEAGTGGGVCTKFTGATNISSNTLISSSWIDQMFVELSERGLFELV